MTERYGLRRFAHIPRGDEADLGRQMRKQPLQKTFRRCAQHSPARTQADRQNILHLFEKARLRNMAGVEKHERVAAGRGQSPGQDLGFHVRFDEGAAGVIGNQRKLALWAAGKNDIAHNAPDRRIHKRRQRSNDRFR